MTEVQSISVLLFPSILCLLSFAIFLRAKAPRGPYPPGPPPKFIIGNALDLPIDRKPWSRYSDWSKRLDSDIVHMSVANTHVIVLQKLEDAIMLLDKRSATYSSRPFVPVVDILGLDYSTSFLPYGERWRKQRRVFEESMKKDQVPLHYQVIRKKIFVFLSELLHDPSNFREHCKWLASATTLAMTFGYHVEPRVTNDYVNAANFIVRTAAELTLPGWTLVNVLPFLRFVPHWVPGARTQKLAANVKGMMGQYKTEPFAYVKNNAVAAKDSMLARSLGRRPELREGTNDYEVLQDTFATMYLAGTETLGGALLTVLFCIALNPESQRKAQEEIDRVVGTDQLPTFDDRGSLPYVEAVHREIQRWKPVLPLGFLHSTVEDDTYKGYYVPKGSFIMPNVWAYTRDETKYHDPERFMPERFLNSDGTLNDDTVNYGFGFGRRICPGKYVADAVLWKMLVCVLSTFNFSKAMDENGNEIDIDPEAFADSLITHPLPFKCSIIPRSQHSEALIRAAANDGGKD